MKIDIPPADQQYLAYRSIVGGEISRFLNDSLQTMS